MKRFKIEYGAQPKLDRWKHYAKNQPAIHNVFCNTLAEALKEANAIIKEHKNFYINVFDTDCEFEGEEHKTMLVVGFDRGIYYNPYYNL